MLSTSDILRLPYDPALTRAGIDYARKSLHYTYNRMRLGTAARLRKIVAGVAVELAFQRWLDAGGVRYDRLGLTPFTERDRYDLRLGGRRCDLKSFLVSDREKIRALRRDPAWLLDAEALVPEDQFAGGSLGEDDLYLFGFLAGLETRSRADLERVVTVHQDLYLLHTPDQTKWLGDAPRREWRSLGRLILKSDDRAPLEVEVGGQDERRGAIVERLRLEPRARAVTEREYYSLLYLHAARPPEGVLGVRSPALRDTHLIAPADWMNIWVYGMEIFIAGWLTKGEFRAKSRRLPAGSSVKQYPRTQTDNRAVRVTALRPPRELAALVRNSEWGKRD